MSAGAAVTCAICGPGVVRLFQITVDGTPLRVGLYLCDDHGDAYLLRVGKAIGEFLKEEAMERNGE